MNTVIYEAVPVEKELPANDDYYLTLPVREDGITLRFDAYDKVFKIWDSVGQVWNDVSPTHWFRKTEIRSEEFYVPDDNGEYLAMPWYLDRNIHPIRLTKITNSK